MVAKIMSGQDIKGALYYNERKVGQGLATCIQASMFWNDPKKLTFNDKLSRFLELNERNHRAKTNTIHISLNFAVNEKLSVEKLNAVASAYMDKIGFGDQPYLVYEHHDAAHQHVHIVSTLIQQDGRRIEIHNLGRNQSEKARKELEKEFALSPAKSAAVSDAVEIKKAVYGKTPTFSSISNIVRHVSKQYKYTSLPELNAALRKFNVVADRGSEKSNMFSKGGLLYWITDESGKKTGVPVKASRIYGKPILKKLEKQFKINEALRLPHKETLRAAIDKILSFKVKDQDQFIKQLAAINVDAVFRSNAEGRVYGLTFIDHRTRAVFKGSDLGKQYSASAITDRFGVIPLYPGSTPISISKGKSGDERKEPERKESGGGQPLPQKSVTKNQPVSTSSQPSGENEKSAGNNFIEDLLRAEYQPNTSSVRKLKKKKRRNLPPQ